MGAREYNKIYVHSDREEGSEKILLGYKNDLAALTLQKDQETIFHIPLYTDSLNVSKSTLIADGATAGPFPAASDRIFKNNKNYGATTPAGNTSDIANGLWYCSWLHKDEFGKVQWKDRFYNPGFFKQNTARTQLLEYVPHNPIYEDRPSKLTLEQGVQYKYFHIGEKYAKHIVSTYGGISGEFLAMDLNGWGTDKVDISNSPKTVNVVTNDPSNNIYIQLTDSDRVSSTNLNFNNNYETAVSINYDPSYNSSNEFTLSFWAHSNSWENSQSTQLVGNYTNKGGYGIFLDTLSSYPFFVIPETGYGHLLLVNEKFESFLDKSIHPTVMLTSTPSFVAVNSDNEVITIEVNQFHKVKKFDHTGILVKETTLESVEFPEPKTEEEKIGNYWAKVSYEGGISEIDISTDYSIWSAINNKGEISISSDKGVSWTVKEDIINCTNIGISQNGLVQNVITNDGKIWISYDAGKTWNQTFNTVVSLTGIELTYVSVSQVGQFQAIAAYDDYIYISPDYGISWHRRAFNNTWKKILVSNDGEFVLALTESQFYISTDYGNTWFPRLEANAWTDIAMSQNGSIQAVTTNGGDIYISTDYGQTWNATPNTTNDWSAIGMSGNGRIQTAVANYKKSTRIYMSFDYGSTWTLKQSIPQTNINKATIKVSDDGKIQLIVTPDSSVYISRENRLMSEYSTIETPLQLLCGKNDEILVITDKARYTYDRDLTLLNAISWRTLENTVAAYSYNTRRDIAELISVENVYDCKFIGTDCYCISATDDAATDGNLYVKYASTNTYEIYADLGPTSKSSTFSIDPYNRIWLMHDNNKITVYDTNRPPGSDPVISTFSIGSDISYAKKNISFMCVYDRETNTRNWRAVVYYGDSGKNIDNPQVYIINMEGRLIKTIDILSLFDLYVVKLLKQSQENMEFLASGDFTGYEFRRVFNNLSPYKNKSQIVLKATLTDSTNKNSPLVHIKEYWPIDDWSFRKWQHFVLTLRNKTFKLYNNSIPILTRSYLGSQDLTFLTQPSFFIGSPVGIRFGFNYEIKNTSAIFNGSIQDIKVYNYAIQQENLEMFLRASILADDVQWTIPTPMVQYIETIERFFKNKIPGAKSSLFNIKVCGMEIKDPGTRKIIEEGIRELVSKIKPAYTDMIKVKWID